MRLFLLNLKRKTMPRQPDEWYEYRPKGRCWAVYLMKRDATGSTGKHIGTYLCREDAKSEVRKDNYKLKKNGTDKV